ncbi:putative dehydrogenase [Aminobacter lissarensis]|uniref:Dehydrogenase n=1 Tax=Aminobacter carboxidus TaxID=376165 RepID=A0A8E2BF81_9HYPH|nr:Gfo/Idh/MocA family oxidoreductase [Aminobacter lissarensis]MBB6469134.1 putative dehydrogenase [Aminobacter lissarensis]
MSMVRYAVVGAGWISQEAFMPGVQQSANSTISAIVSGSKESANRLAEFYDIPHVVAYEDFDDFLAGDEVDAVYLALPNSRHADYAIRAAKAGKHVLVEKPLAISEAECRAMIAAAQENNVHLVTAYRLHNEPGTLDVLARIAAGEIGDPRIFASAFSFVQKEGNHRLSAKYWGGPLQDIGIYCLNAMRHVFGVEPEEVTAVASDGGGNPLFAEVPETVAVTLRFPGGRIGQFLVSFGASDQDFYMVSGTKGSFMLDPGFRFEMATELEHRVGLVRTRKTYPRTDQFAGMADYLSHCILTGRSPRLTGDEGLADVVILRAIERAAATGKAQTIPKLPDTIQPEMEMKRELPATERRLVL